MWEFLSNLPTPLSYSLIVLCIIAIVLIAIKGHLKAGTEESIEIGSDRKEKNSPVLPPPQTVTIIQKRSCGDCILLLMGEREKYEMEMRKEANKILKDQMSFVEQKLIEIQNSFMGSIIDAVHEFVAENPTAVDESIQHKLIYGLFKDALIGVKDEIRRSFKDNGFFDLNNAEFTAYTKDRVSVISSMLNQYIRNMFPNKPGLLSLNEVVEIARLENNFLSILIHDLYAHARESKIEAEARINRIQQDFGRWVDEFIKPSFKEDV
jgi:hypothetical protein